MMLINTMLFAAAAFLASFVVIALAWVMSRGRAAAVRHLVWSGAFAVLLALPVAALALPSLLQWTLIAPSTPTPAPAAGFDYAQVLLGIAALWLVGVVFHLIRLAIAGIGLVRLHRRSVAHIPDAIDAAPFRGLCWQLRLRTSPGKGEAGPLTWGVVRPVVLLPKCSVTWPRERLTSVLLHEAAHVRRRDYLWRLVALAAGALYWPNPLVWIAARAQRADAERAADDCVLTAGVKPTRYAEHLVGLAREFSGASFAVGMSMAEHRLLDTRVKAILDPHQSRSAANRMDVVTILAVGVAVTAALALARPSLAEGPTVDHRTATARPSIARPVEPIPAEEAPAPAAVPPPPAPPSTFPAVPEPPAAPEPPVEPAGGVAPIPPVPPQMHIEFSDGEKAALRQAANADTRRALAEAHRALANVNIHQTVAVALQQAEQAMRRANVGQAAAAKRLAASDMNRIVADAMKQAETAMRRAEAEARNAEDAGQN